MARNALPTSSSSISRSAKSGRNCTPPKPNGAMLWCGKSYALFSEGKSGWNTKPHRQCIDCYRSNYRSRRRQGRNVPEADKQIGAGAIFAQVSPIRLEPLPNIRKITLESSSFATSHHRLRHNVFSKGQWRKSQVMDHPEVQLELSVLPADCHFGRKCPRTNPIKVTDLADSDAQSCLWSLRDFLAAGLTMAEWSPFLLILSQPTSHL